jgi:predicted O-methyltransferase YrrM
MKYNLTDYPQYDFFTYSLYYSYIAQKLKNGDIFVEIGSWLGQSAVFMAEKIKQRNLNVKFYTIDFFDSDEIKESSWEMTMEITKEKKIYETYLENIEHVKDYIVTIIGNSKEVYKQFEDESIDYLFIDGDHTHEGFAQDIKLWYPKVKTGGIVSGHDYIWGGKGVKPVIDAFSMFKAKPFGFGDVWFYTK